MSAYEKPVITRLSSGTMNKVGRSLAYERRVRTEIDGVAVEELAARFGSPLFVFSERRLRRRYREVHQAFSARYPRVEFGWSYKTNYLGAICALMHREGALAEVVSGMEFDMSLRLGVPGERIILNGPYHPAALLRRAAEAGAAVNLDNLDQLCDMERAAGGLGRQVDVGLRVNLDAGISPQWSRFGFNLENGQAFEAARRIRSGGTLRLDRLHCHLGTFILEPAAYAREAEKMVRFAYEVEEKLGFAIHTLDLGGGLPSHNRLKGTYLAPDVGVPAADEYAESLCGAFAAALRPGDFPRLVLECGRTLVDEAGFLVATVVGSKRLPDGAKAYVLDAGTNLLFTSYWYRPAVELAAETGGVNEAAVLYGPLCMNIDVVSDACRLPPLARGARLVISPVGAYNTTQWQQFIHYRPNVVLVGEEGAVEVIRAAETLEDVLRSERIPDRLAGPGGRP